MVVGMLIARALCIPLLRVQTFVSWLPSIQPLRSTLSWQLWCFSSNFHFIQSHNEEKGCTALSYRAMVVLKIDSNIVDSRWFTLLSFARVPSPIDHSSNAILHVDSPDTSESASSHTFCQFRPLCIFFLIAFDCPRLLTNCLPSSSDVSSSVLWCMLSTWSTHTLFLLIDIFSFPFVLFGPFSFLSFLSENSKLVPW